MGRLLPNSLSPIFVSWVRCLPGQLYKVEGIQDNEMNWTDHYGVCCAASSQVGFCDDKVLKRYNQFLYYYLHLCPWDHWNANKRHHEWS